MWLRLRKYIELMANWAAENYSRPGTKSDIYNCLVYFMRSSVPRIYSVQIWVVACHNSVQQFHRPSASSADCLPAPLGISVWNKIDVSFALTHVVERRSVTGELSLSYARPAADGWPLMWVNRVLQGQPTRPTQPFILSWVVSSVSCCWMCTISLVCCHLVNAYGVKAGWFIPLVDKCVGGSKTVWSL